MRDPQAIWLPSSNFTPGRNGYRVIGAVNHITQGFDSLAWLRGAAGGSSNRGSSAQYLISRDGTLRQMVDDLDTSWAAGNLLFNFTRIQIEHEGWSGQPLTISQIRTSAGLNRRLAERHGYSLDRNHVIGHADVPDPDDPGYWGGDSRHTGCPGTAFPWDQILGKAPAETAPPEEPLKRFVAPTGFYIEGGFLTFWIDNNENQENLRVLGWPLSNEFQAHVPGQPQIFTYQVFERGVLTYRSGNPDPWKIYVVMPDEGAAVRVWAKANGKM